MLEIIDVPHHADEPGWTAHCFDCNQIIAEGTWWRVQEQKRLHKSTPFGENATHSITIVKVGVLGIPASQIEIPQHSIVPDWTAHCMSCMRLRVTGTWWHVMEKKRMHLKEPYGLNDGHEIHIFRN